MSFTISFDSYQGQLLFINICPLVLNIFNYFAGHYSVNMIKAVLFDLDNTLVDFMKMKKMASEAAVSAMIDSGLAMDEEKAIEKLFSMYETHGFEDQTILDKFIKENNKDKLDYKMLAAAVVAYRKVKSGYLTPYPHVQKVLIKLKENGIKLGIVSDAPVKQAWLRLAELRLMEFFDIIIAVGGTGKEKPHKMPFESAINELKLRANEILFVGDNPNRDILGAKRIGMKTALAKYGQVRKGGEKADYILNDVEDILEIVDE